MERNAKLIFPLLAVLLLCFCSAANATVHIPTSAHLGFANGAYVSFASSVSASSVHRSGGYWTFTNLDFGGATNSFSIYAGAANVTMTRLSSSWINYTVNNLGTQTFSIPNFPEAVYIDGVNCAEGSGWTHATGWITVYNSNYTVAVLLSPDTMETSDLAATLIACLILVPLALLVLFAIFRRR